MAIAGQNSRAIEEEVDFYKLIRSIGRRWVVLLIFMILGGSLAGVYQFLKKPSYQAMSVISIDSTSLLNKTSPLFLVQSDPIRSEIAQTLGVSQGVLSNVTIAFAKNEKTIIDISAETDDPNFSVTLVNTWAEIATRSINHDEEMATSQIDAAQQAANSADAALLTYLYDNGLADLTWVDLVAITGVGDQLNTIYDSNKIYPPLTLIQRKELTNLVRQKDLAEWNFNQVSNSVLSSTVASKHQAEVINKAIRSERSNRLLAYLIIPLGVLCGFLLSIVLILIWDWWKNSQPLEISPKSSE
jgi:hypothetical protein